MSQLSSGGRPSRVKLKKSYDTLWFLLTFAVVCIIITIVCIIVKKVDKTGSISAFGEGKDTSKVISLGDKIWTNGLEIETKQHEDGEILSTYDEPESGNVCKYEYTYEQISGLKNKTIQERINKDIELTTLSYGKMLDEHPEYDRISVTTTVESNYSDVLSVQINYYLINQNYQFNQMDDIYGHTGLNYRLDTGEKLYFQDLFRSDVSIKTVLADALYEAFAWQIAYESETNGYDFEEIDYGYIENQTFKALAEYNKNPDIDFYFTTNYIMATIRDFDFMIEFKDNCEKMAVFTKYIADDLYEDTSLQNEIYACTSAYINDSIEAEGMRGDNFYYEIITYTSNEEEKEDVLEAAQKAVDKKLTHYHEIAKKHPDTAYMVSVIYFVGETYETKTPYYQYDGYVVQMPMSYFKEHKDEIIVRARNTEHGEIWAYDFSEYDEKAEFYEQFSAHVDHYLSEDYKEEIITKKDREKMEQEWQEELKKAEEMANTIDF